MTDRALLEAAAKAADRDFNDPAQYLNESGRPWNPLADDGDALRLAVKLSMRVRAGVVTTAEHGIFGEGSKAKTADPCAATRRAIVRAAAAIGSSGRDLPHHGFTTSGAIGMP